MPYATPHAQTASDPSVATGLLSLWPLPPSGQPTVHIPPRLKEPSQRHHLEEEEDCGRNLRHVQVHLESRACLVGMACLAHLLLCVFALSPPRLSLRSTPPPFFDAPCPSEAPRCCAVTTTLGSEWTGVRGGGKEDEEGRGVVTRRGEARHHMLFLDAGPILRGLDVRSFVCICVPVPVFVSVTGHL